MDQFVIIPRSGEDLTEAMYFDPRIVKILSGMSITWMNRDTKTHRFTPDNADSLYQLNFSKLRILMKENQQLSGLKAISLQFLTIVLFIRRKEN